MGPAPDFTQQRNRLRQGKLLPRQTADKPPAANPNPSALESIAGAAGAAVGTATGMPWLAFLVPALVGLVTRRKAKVQA